MRGRENGKKKIYPAGMHCYSKTEAPPTVSQIETVERMAKDLGVNVQANRTKRAYTQFIANHRRKDDSIS